ncbi:MAG: hypothetical protein OXN25_08965 [Candidatus Poribacteria bacterium]|nr:hypothetical protein [Candidatus Poribacteria bacterium]
MFVKLNVAISHQPSEINGIHALWHEPGVATQPSQPSVVSSQPEDATLKTPPLLIADSR